jgi:hypothetical protein
MEIKTVLNTGEPPPVFELIHEDEQLKIFAINRENLSLAYALSVLTKGVDWDKCLFNNCGEWITEYSHSKVMPPDRSLSFLVERNEKYYTHSFRCSKNDILSLTPSIAPIKGFILKKDDCLAIPQPPKNSVWPSQRLKKA